MVGHVGARLLADPADATGLTGALSEALTGLRSRRGPGPGRGGSRLPKVHAAGRLVPGLVLDLDASIVLCHIERQSVTRVRRMHWHQPTS